MKLEQAFACSLELHQRRTLPAILETKIPYHLQTLPPKRLLQRECFS
jgi:hypothetical protein